MGKLRIDEVTVGHVSKLAADLREADKQEILASTGANPVKIITQSVLMSDKSFAVSVSGQLLYIIGVVKPSLLGFSGIPWLLGTNEIKNHKRDFLKSSYELLKAEQKELLSMHNYVDARNKDSIKWLRFMGFELEDAKPYGVMQKPFHRFSWRKNNV